ncbi:MAG: hypothetical protein AAGC72_12315 [Planctomycetota bacterium]
MRSILMLLALSAVIPALPGCRRASAYTPPTSAELVADARREVDHERRLRQSIVLVVPKEQAVIQALRDDPRVRSAHFASINTYLTTQWLGRGGSSPGDSYWFVMVFESIEELTEQQAQAVLHSALDKAGLSLLQASVPLVNDGMMWASEYSFEARLAPITQPEPLTISSFEHLLPLP